MLSSKGPATYLPTMRLHTPLAQARFLAAGCWSQQSFRPCTTSQHPLDRGGGTPARASWQGPRARLSFRARKHTSNLSVAYDRSPLIQESNKFMRHFAVLVARAMTPEQPRCASPSALLPPSPPFLLLAWRLRGARKLAAADAEGKGEEERSLIKDRTKSHLLHLTP